MIGMNVSHPSGVSGTVDATVVHADGSAFARVDDHWLPVEELA